MLGVIRKGASAASVLRASASAFAICAMLHAGAAFAQTVPESTEDAPATEAQETSTQAADETTGITSNPSSPAEEAATEEDGAIVVTGIRRSLKRSQDIKRE